MLWTAGPAGSNVFAFPSACPARSCRRSGSGVARARTVLVGGQRDSAIGEEQFQTELRPQRVLKVDQESGSPGLPVAKPSNRVSVFAHQQILMTPAQRRVSFTLDACSIRQLR